MYLQRLSKVPTLEFGSLYVNNEPAYFLRVRKSRGQGLAESCEAYLFVEGSNIGNFPTVWSDGNARHCDIGIYKDLRLFKVEKEHYEYATMKIPKSITFRRAKLTKGFTEERRLYSDFIGKKLTIRVTAKNGNIPKPFTKQIADIIEEAISESSLDTSVTSKYQTTNND